jgi:hypothetical protein
MRSGGLTLVLAILAAGLSGSATSASSPDTAPTDGAVGTEVLVTRTAVPAFRLIRDPDKLFRGQPSPPDAIP